MLEIAQDGSIRASRREKAGVAALMLLLSLVMTWPLALHPARAINDYGDPLLNSWILWWVIKALVTPGLALFEAPIFFPEHLTLAYSEHLLTSALTVSPVLLLGGDAVLAHNLMFLVALTVAGLGMYLLGLELTGSRPAALVMALAFAFSPYRFGHLGHLQMQTNHFMPLVLLYLHRWAKAPRWPLALAFGLFWLLQILSCGYYALFISLAVGLFLLFYGLRGRWWRDLKRLRQLMMVAAGIGLLVAPLYAPYIKVKQEMGFKRAESLAAGFSAKPENYLAAPPANLLFGRGSEGFRDPEGELLLGLGLTTLVLAGLLRPASPARRRTRGAAIALAHLAGFWLLAGLVLLSGGLAIPLGAFTWTMDSPLKYLLLFLGAAAVWRVLDMGGLAEARRAGPARFLGLKPAEGQGALAHVGVEQRFYLLLAGAAFWASLGPDYGLYDLLYKLVPGFEALRVPSRLAVLVQLAWAVLAGYGWLRLTALWPGRPRLGGAALAGVCLFLLLEACSVPLPWLLMREDTPAVYQWLAKQPAGTVTLELPMMGFNEDSARDARYLYWSTKHGQPLINGYSGYFSKAYGELAVKGRRPSRTDVLDVAREMGAKVLVYHAKEFASSERSWQLEKFARDKRLRPVYQDEWDHAYEILPRQAQQP
jgi:hypothetical protein